MHLFERPRAPGAPQAGQSWAWAGEALSLMASASFLWLTSLLDEKPAAAEAIREALENFGPGTANMSGLVEQRAEPHCEHQQPPSPSAGTSFISGDTDLHAKFFNST